MRLLFFLRGAVMWLGTGIIHACFKLYAVCGSGEVIPKPQETQHRRSRPTQWNLSHMLRLFKKPPVWYSFVLWSFTLHQHRTTWVLQPLPPQPSLLLCLFFSLRSMFLAHMCASSTSNTLLSWLPTYFKESFPHADVCFPRPVCHHLARVIDIFRIPFENQFLISTTLSCRTGCTM